MPAGTFDEQLRQILANVQRPVAGAYLTYAQDNLSADIVTLRCEFRPDRTEGIRGKLDYGWLTLGEAWLSVNEALELILGLNKGVASINGRQISDSYSFSGELTDRRIHQSQGITEWPEWVFELRRQNGVRHLPKLHMPLVCVGQRPYKSAALAIAAWVWNIEEPWGGGNPPHLSEVVVAIPDTRGRVVSVEWRPNILRILTSISVPRSEIEVQGTLQGLGTTVVVPGVSPQADGYLEWPVEPTTTRADIYMVHKVDGLLWHGDFPNTGTKIRANAAARSAEEVAEIDLRSGESEQVEFKPFLVFGEEGEKPAEFVQTVVAFANSAGGRLYVGIRDDATPQGSAAFIRAARTQPENAERSMLERVDKLIRDNVKPVPAFVAEVLRISGEPVFVFRVDRGHDRPYATHANDVWVRKGATNRKPDPRTELQDLYDSEETLPEIP